MATADQAVRYSLATGTGIYHAVGAAAMGAGDDDVTDPQLRVAGPRGCGSPTPRSSRSRSPATPAAPAMLVGYRAADLILGDL